MGGGLTARPLAPTALMLMVTMIADVWWRTMPVLLPGQPLVDMATSGCAPLLDLDELNTLLDFFVCFLPHGGLETMIMGLI